MKITIELDENLPDDEIRVHCRRMTEELQKIQEAFASGHTETKRLVLYQGDLECYVDVLDILFFETEGTIVQVHTRDEIYDETAALRIGGDSSKSISACFQIDDCKCGGNLFAAKE